MTPLTAKALLLGCLCALVSASTNERDVAQLYAANRDRLLEVLGRQPASGPHRRQLQVTGESTLNITQCLWDGIGCVLSDGFVASLPGKLGNPTTDSAKVLARAAYRSTVCANLTTSRVACLAAAGAYGCDWDTLTQSCGIADLLDPELLRGAAYCPNSRLDAAVSCAAISLGALDPADGGAWKGRCASSSYGGYACGLVEGSAALAAAEGGASAAEGLGGVLMGLVNGIASGSLVRAAERLNVSSDAAAALLANASAVANSSQVCAAQWTSNTTFLRSLADTVSAGVRSGKDILSTLMTPQLFGTCNGTQRLMDVVNACPVALTQVSCTALSGCRWFDAAGACTVASDVVESMMLDAQDIWTLAYRNASTLCRSIADQSTCTSSAPIALNLNASLIRPLADLLPSFVTRTVINTLNGNGTASGDGASGGGGGGGGGGAAGAAAASWWMVLAGAAVAVAVSSSSLLGPAAHRGY